MKKQEITDTAKKGSLNTTKAKAQTQKTIVKNSGNKGKINRRA